MDLMNAREVRIMNNIEEILTAIIKADYKTLVDYLSEEEIKKYRVETNDC